MIDSLPAFLRQKLSRTNTTLSAMARVLHACMDARNHFLSTVLYSQFANDGAHMTFICCQSNLPI